MIQSHRVLKALGLSALLSSLILTPASTAPLQADNALPWMNTNLSPDQRADLVLKQMTLDEKLWLVRGHSDIFSPNYNRPPESLEGDGFVPAIPRLGLPALQIIGAGVGITNMGRRKNAEATLLPSSLAETATWDPQMAYQFGTVIGKETRDQGFNVSIGGGVDLTREPRNGRNFEYHGEDPLLAGKIVGREVRAIQDQHLVADVKHYAVNDQETGRDIANAILDRRSMRESDLLAFEIALKESDAGVVMCSYNQVDGVYACENPYLLDQVLKKDWGFTGWVMSDWGATHSTVQAVRARLDQEMPTGVYFDGELRQAIAKGEVPTARLNDMVHRILRTEFACGIVDHPPVIQPSNFPADFAIAQRVEANGAVLLKNHGSLLPLDASRLHSIAVIGSHADVGVLSGSGSPQVTPVGGNAVPPAAIPPGQFGFLGFPVWVRSSPLQAIRAKAPNVRVTYDPGTDFGAAAKLAGAADVAIVFVNQWTHEGEDVPSLSLPGHQDDLVQRVAAANPHTIVVLETGGAVLMPWIRSVPAALEAWYPGQRGGEAIADLFFGEVNPSGKLPITFPKSDADLPHPTIAAPPPDASSHSRARSFDVDCSEGLKVGYKWYDAENKEPLFPFAFGLSYTNFAYSNLEVTNGDEPRLSFNVRNTGSRAGAEIGQVYLGLPAGAGEPPKRLVAWQKVHLQPGEVRRVSLTVSRQMISIFDVQRDAWEEVPGEYHLFVGASSRDIRLTGTWQQ